MSTLHRFLLLFSMILLLSSNAFGHFLAKNEKTPAIRIVQHVQEIEKAKGYKQHVQADIDSTFSSDGSQPFSADRLSLVGGNWRGSRYFLNRGQPWNLKSVDLMTNSARFQGWMMIPSARLLSHMRSSRRNC